MSGIMKWWVQEAAHRNGVSRGDRLAMLVEMCCKFRREAGVGPMSGDPWNGTRRICEDPDLWAGKLETAEVDGDWWTRAWSSVFEPVSVQKIC